MPTPQQFTMLRRSVVTASIRIMAVVEFERRFSGLVVPDEERLVRTKRLPVNLHPENYDDLGAALSELGGFLQEVAAANRHEDPRPTPREEARRVARGKTERPLWPLFDPSREAQVAKAVFEGLYDPNEEVEEILGLDEIDRDDLDDP